MPSPATPVHSLRMEEFLLKGAFIVGVTSLVLLAGQALKPSEPRTENGSRTVPSAAQEQAGNT
jgi:hypothetical protein